jgi:VanZ family protein
MRFYFFIWMILALVWTGVIFIFSSQSYSEQEVSPFIQKLVSDSTLRQYLPDVPIEYNHTRYSPDINPFHWMEFLFRKSAHLFMYGVLAVLWSLTLRSRLTARRSLILVLLTIVLTAAADEWNQSFIKGRSGFIGDVGIDLMGGLVGFHLLTILYRIKYKTY